MKKEIPPVLYKYRQFTPQTLRLLCSDLVFFADPSTFNDPLDTKPCVEADCDVPTLQGTVYELVRRRVESEMKAGARAVKYRGPKTIAHIDKHSRAAAQRTIDTLAYDATNPEYTDPPPAPLINLLAYEIERELLLQYDRGILSLAKRFDCPLMWSHYGDQHASILPAARRAVKPLADKAGRFVLPRSREARVPVRQPTDKQRWFVFKRPWRNCKR